jgi:hypothetical protein
MEVRNFFGHDDESEIITIIKKLQRNQFEIQKFENNTFTFKIIYRVWNSVPISSTYLVEKEFTITKEDNYTYIFKQVNGTKSRIIEKTDGYIIWCLLIEKLIS